MTPSLRLRSSLVLALLGIAASGRAGHAIGDGHIDSVDLQSTGTSRVQGTIRSAAERESFVLELPHGARVTAAVKRKGKSALVPQLDLVDGALSPVPGTVTKATKTGMKLSHPSVPESDTYRLRVFSDFQHDGDYTLVFSTKFATRFRETGTSAPAAFQNVCVFGAPAGAQARVRVAPAKGSAFVPVLEQIVGPDAFSVALPAAADSGWQTLGGAGEYFAGFRDGGAAGGDWVCTVQLRKLPRIRKSKVDISAGKLTGSFDDDQAVFGVLVGSEAAVLDPDDLGLGLDGASVAIPDGALSLPVVITMSVAPNFSPPGGDSPAGPAITFGPQGQTFQQAVQVTIPFDADAFDDPENELTVYVLHAGDPAPEAVPKPYTFPGPGLVSFPRSSFSTFQPGRAGPRGLAGPFALVQLESYGLQGFGGVARAEVSRVTFDTRSGYTQQTDARRVAWDNGTGVPWVQFVDDTDLRTGTSFVQDATSVLLSEGEGDFRTYRRSGAGDVMILEPDETSGFARLQMLLRIAPGVPTFTNVAGRWNLLYVSAGATAPDVIGPRLYTEVITGTAQFALDGRVDFVLDGTSAGADFPGGAWTAAARKRKAPGELVATDGVAFLRLPSEQGPGQTAYPLTACLGGDVLVTRGEPSGDALFVLVLARQGKGLGRGVFPGTTATFGLGFATRDADAGVPSPSRFDLSGRTGSLTYTGGARIAVGASGGFSITHDDLGNPMVGSFEQGGGDVPFTVTPAGAVRIGDARGFVTRRSDLVLVGSCSRDGSEVRAGFPGVSFGTRTK